MARCSRSSRDRTLPSHSSRSGLASSAAAVGVAARRSAAKSAIVTSVSCPMPVTTGIEHSTIARATISSLKAHKSSSEPPPRTRSNTSQSRRWDARWIAWAMRAAAPSPCTGTGWISTGRPGQRRRRVASTSRSAAPVGDVMTPIWRGKRGRGYLRSGANQPARSRRSRNSS